MSFLSRIFGDSKRESTRPDIRFGRFSDAYKTGEQYDAWDRSITLFEEKKYMKSYLNFFEYLKNPEEDNVSLERQGQILDFELRQGSLLIHGRIDGKRIRVEATLAKSEELPPDLLQQLMEWNYNLKYSRYALNGDQNICIVFDSFLIDGSPYKLYYGLKELAIQADKMDDLLLKEFPFLEPVEEELVRSIPERERAVKYEYLLHSLDELFSVLDEGALDIDEQPNAGMYLILECCYRLDYLLRPEGAIRDIFEKIHGLFATQDGVHPLRKIERAREYLDRVGNMKQSSVYGELYDVSSTFGRITPVDYDWIGQFVAGERLNMNWYLDENLDSYALAVSGYIVGYQLFNFAVPAPMRSLYHLYYQVIEEPYFSKLGYKRRYHTGNGSLRASKIKKQFRSIEEQFEDSDHELNLEDLGLDYHSDARWAYSFLELIQTLADRK